LGFINDGIVALVGNYGSGKTEVAINLAARQRRAGGLVRVADLDLVNPYFRTREARRQLTHLGIEVVLPPAELLQADLPVLTPAVAGAIRRDHGLTLLDVGGDGVGARVLAALADAWRGRDLTVWQVINPLRPETDREEGCRRVQARIEAASGLPVDGWVVNAHCMDQTTWDDIRRGVALVEGLAQATGKSIALVTAPARLIAAGGAPDFAWPLLPMRRQLVPPWLAAETL
jgi:hypothetical protein